MGVLQVLGIFGIVIAFYYLIWISTAHVIILTKGTRFNWRLFLVSPEPYYEWLYRQPDGEQKRKDYRAKKRKIKSGEMINVRDIRIGTTIFGYKVYDAYEYGAGYTKIEIYDIFTRQPVTIIVYHGEDGMVTADTLQRLVYQAITGEPMKDRKEELPLTQQYNGAIRGWRIWYVNSDNNLKALVKNHVWKPGKNVCDNLPTKGGSDGFYAFNELQHLKSQENGMVEAFRKGQNTSAGHVIIGSVLCTGRIVRARQGYRTEIAQPEYFILPDKDVDYQYQVMTLAEKYGAKVITVDEAKLLKTGLVPYREEEIK